MLNCDLGTMVSFQAQGKLSKAALDAIRRAFELQAKVQEANRRINTLEQENREITSDQARIRSNMGSVDRNSDLYRRYVTKLNEQETRLEQIVGDLEAARNDLRARQQALDSYVANLSIE